MTDREQLLDEIRKLVMNARLAHQYPSVVELLHAYLQHRPAHGAMWYQFGDALRIMGLNHEAERAFNNALTNSPEKRAAILARLGQVHADAGRRTEAEAAFAEACIDPEFGSFGWVWTIRGCNLAADTQLAAAEKCHRHALTLDDDNLARDEAFLNLGYVLRAEGRYAEAADAFRSALKIIPDYPEALEELSGLEGIEEAMQKAKELSKYNDQNQTGTP